MINDYRLADKQLPIRVYCPPMWARSISNTPRLPTTPIPPSLLMELFGFLLDEESNRILCEVG